MVKNNKAQNFSADILVVIVILLFGVLFLVMNQVSNQDSKKLDNTVKVVSQETDLILDQLKASSIIDDKNNVNVGNLMLVDVDKIKEDANIKGEFCIVFEKDGNLVKIDSENKIHGVGSDKILVNNAPCKSS